LSFLSQPKEIEAKTVVKDKILPDKKPKKKRPRKPKIMLEQSNSQVEEVALQVWAKELELASAVK
jgi:hypothetical protein